MFKNATSTADAKLNAAPPRPAFHLRGEAEIRHINVRKEGPDDDKILAADIKLRFAQCPAGILDYFDDKLAAYLWIDDNVRAVRKANLEPIRFADWVDGTAKIAGIEFNGITAKKFAIAAEDGGLATITCSVTIYPSEREVGELALNVQDFVKAEIKAHPDLFDKPAGEAE